jgi:hypothetical protein
LGREVIGRTPWGVERLLRRHDGETGIVAYSWCSRVRSHESITVKVDRDGVATLRGWRRGPVWIPLAAGAHYVEFVGRTKVFGSEQLVLPDGAVTFVAFKPPTRTIFFTRQSSRWCVHHLR